jgi:hypothetical protein
VALLQTPSATTCGGGQWAGQEARESPADTASRQQLQQLAEAMQQQLDMLAQAVTELRQVGNARDDCCTAMLSQNGSALVGDTCRVPAVRPYSASSDNIMGVGEVVTSGYFHR